MINALKIASALGGASAGASITYLTSAASGTDGSTFTFNNVDIVKSGLLVIAAYGESSSTNVVNSVTFDGVSCTEAIKLNNSGRANGIFYLNVSYSGAKTVVVTLSNGSTLRAGISVWRIDGAASTTPVATKSLSQNHPYSSASVSYTSLPSGAVVISNYVTGEHKGPYSWSNSTERYETSVASESFGATGADAILSGNQTISVSHTASVAEQSVLLSAAWN